MTKPTELPVWASGTVTLPVAGTANKLQPDSTMTITGFDYRTRPRAQWENWWRHNVYQWIDSVNKEGVLGWDSATTYPVNAFVTGSNGKLYKAIQSQAGNNPTTDGGVNWEDYLPDASSTVKGKVELATNTEVSTGTDTTRAVTPAGLASRTASTTKTGLIEIATQTEMNTGTDTSRAVTPELLKNWSKNPAAILSSPGQWVDNHTGFTVKWGTFLSNADGNVPVTFATPFNSACVSVIHGGITGFASVANVWTANSVTASGFNSNRDDSVSGSVTVLYIAFGY